MPPKNAAKPRATVPADLEPSQMVVVEFCYRRRPGWGRVCSLGRRARRNVDHSQPAASFIAGSFCIEPLSLNEAPPGTKKKDVGLVGRTASLFWRPVFFYARHTNRATAELEPRTVFGLGEEKG